MSRPIKFYVRMGKVLKYAGYFKDFPWDKTAFESFVKAPGVPDTFKHDVAEVWAPGSGPSGWCSANVSAADHNIAALDEVHPDLWEFLISQLEPEAPKRDDRFPHVCPGCSGPAWIGFIDFECKSICGRRNA